MRKNGARLSSACLVVLLLALVSSTSWADSVNKVKFGVTVSMSGVWAPNGALHTKAWTAAEWAINEMGGVYVPQLGKKVPLDIIVYDDASDSTQAIRMYEKLINIDKVHVLFGPFGSPLTMAVSAVSEKYKVPMMALNATNYKLFTRGLKYLWGIQLVSFGYGRTPLQSLKDAMAEGVIPEKKLRIALIYDTTEWEPQYRGFKAALEDYKDYFDIAVEIPYELGASSFQPVISRLAKHQFDALIGFSTYSDICGIVKYMRMANFRPKYVFLFDANLPEFIPEFGSAAEGICSFWDWPTPAPDATPAYSKFRQYFLEHGWGEPNVVYQTGPFAGLEAVVQAIEKVGLDPEKIKDHLNSAEFQTCVGRMKFGTLTMCGETMRGVNLYALGCVYQVQDGKYVQIWPREYAEGTLRYPLPPTF